MIARVPRKPRTITILDAINDPNLFGQHFRKGEWNAWRTFLAALFGLPLTEEQQELFRQCTGRTQLHGSHQEAWLVVGRRGGKSFMLATTAVYLAAFKDWRPHLGPGECATVMVIAADRKQARVIMRYVKGLLASVPMLNNLIAGATRESISLRSRVVIEVHSASFRSTRGYSIVAALLDEIAFWPTDDSAEPDFEIINAIRPGMATIPGAMLLCASSPYARRGALWDAHRRHFNKDGDPILVWRAPTQVMNPTIRPQIIDEAMERDPASANAEYFAQFRSDVEAFINREVVQHCVSVGIHERPPIPGVFYSAFVDPSGGAGDDSMTLAIGHDLDHHVILDAVREIRPPFSPEFVVEEFATLLKSYGVYTVEGDRFGGEFARAPFRDRNIAYEIAAKAKSELYAHHLLPMLNSGRVDLLDHARLFQQIVGLERHTARSGRDSIDHAPHAHDDLANCVAGLVARVGGGGYRWDGAWISDSNTPPPEDAGVVAERRRKLSELLKTGAPIPF